MRKIIMLAVGLSLAIVQSIAQNVEVASCELLELDLTANTHGTIKYDQNDEKAALIKIQTPERGFTFDGGALGIVAMEEHTGEIWLYVPRQSKKLTIKHKDYGVKRDYYYPIPIEGGHTYEMYIDIGMGRYVTITSQRANSTIFIDGAEVGKSPIKNLYLNYGKHTVMAKKDRYEGEQSFMITTNDEQRIRLINVEQRDMSDRYGDVIVNVDSKADIYFEGKKVGTGTWKTQLREGSYMVETRKADCDPAKTSFTVVAQRKNDIKVNAPIPHTGYLSILTRPGGVKSTYNGDHFIDLSETVSVPVGTYQMVFSRKGFEPQNREYVVRHNEMTVDTVELSRISYLKSTSFYFGAAFTLRNLSGISGFIGATYKNHDIQASYTLGLMESERTNWLDSEKTFIGASKHKLNTFSIKYGYQIPVINQLAFVPQVGYSLNMISSTLEDKANMADGAKAGFASIGAKVLCAPLKHFYAFIAPEFDIALSNDEDYKTTMEKAGYEMNGFVLNAGILINF